MKSEISNQKSPADPAKLLLQHFDSLAETPGAVQTFRDLILDLAVRGRLTTQDPRDGIFNIAQGHGHAITESPAAAGPDEALFPIPQNWIWLRFGDVFEIEGGTQPPKSQFVDSPRSGYIRLLQIRDFGLKPVPTYIPHTPKLRTCTTDDVMLARYGASVGKVLMGQEGAYNVALTKVVFDHAKIPCRFVYWWLQTSQMQQVLTGMSRSAQAGFNKGDLFPVLLPFPPLPEQRRIVAKVEELLALCDQLEARQTTARKHRSRLVHSALDHLTTAKNDQDFQKHVSFILHKSPLILDCIPATRQAIACLAAQGRLVPQNQEDEPATELLQRILSTKKHLAARSGEKPVENWPTVRSEHFSFALPKGWTLVRLGDLAIRIEAGFSPQCEGQPKTAEEWGVLKISAVSWDVFDPDENKALPAHIEPPTQYEVKPGDFLMSRANTAELIAKSVVVRKTPPRLLLNDKTLRVHFTDHINKSFLNLVNNSSVSRAYYASAASGTSSSMKNISREGVLMLPVALPPLAEQHRIVAKVDELMHRCSELELQCTNGATNAIHLLEVSVRQIFET